MIYRPKLATSPRPDDRPFYIRSTCPKCTHCLVLAYKILNPDANEAEIFYDEWICPDCPERVCYLDWPEEDNKNEEYKNAFGGKQKNYYN